jgi:hypothetical protein
VSPHVTGDHIASACSVRALRALVGLLARVCALVCGEMIGAREHLPAHPTGIRFDSRVQTHVSRQHIAASERSLADLAEVRLGGRIVAVLSALVSRRHVLSQPVV